MNNPSASGKQRLEFVDVTKGICILLVVLGHYNPSGAPAWYESLVRFVYSFHMQVFMCMSGFLFYKGFNRQLSLPSFIVKKFKRLMVPYFVVSLLLISVKLLIQQFIPIESPVPVDAFIQMFYTPIAGFFLWFMYTLFIIFILVACFFKYLKYGLEVLSILSLAVYAVIDINSLPHWGCLPQVINTLPAFLLGCWMFRFVQVIDQKILIPLLIACHIAGFIVLNRFQAEGNMLHLFNMLLGIPACMYIPQLVKLLMNKPRAWVAVLFQLGIMSNAIYLFHTFSMAPFKFAWMKFIGIDTLPLFLASVLLIVGCGVVIPVFLKKLILKNKLLSALVLGE